jgi:hypothetical protein
MSALGKQRGLMSGYGWEMVVNEGSNLALPEAPNEDDNVDMLHSLKQACIATIQPL